MATVLPQHVRLEGIQWDTYECMAREIEGRRVKLTYDSGVLEIMTPSDEHEYSKKLLARMIEAMTEERSIPIRSGGSATQKRRALAKGLEPDECYWIANEASVRHRIVDPDQAPPPDLVLEVDVYSRSLDRMAIYAALGVPEVWRHDEAGLVLHVLRDGSYQRAEHSACFPWLDVAEFGAWLARVADSDETRWIRSFRAWVRETAGTDRRNR